MCDRGSKLLYSERPTLYGEQAEGGQREAPMAHTMYSNPASQTLRTEPWWRVPPMGGLYWTSNTPLGMMPFFQTTRPHQRHKGAGMPGRGMQGGGGKPHRPNL